MGLWNFDWSWFEVGCNDNLPFPYYHLRRFANYYCGFEPSRDSEFRAEFIFQTYRKFEAGCLECDLLFSGEQLKPLITHDHFYFSNHMAYHKPSPVKLKTSIPCHDFWSQLKLNCQRTPALY